MSTTTLNTKFQLRRDLVENWITADPVLADGEPVLAEVEGVYKLKIGDGETVFSELPYYGDSSSGSDADWVTLLNKPFYEKQVAAQTITANYTDNLVSDTEEMITILKISNEVYTADEIKLFIFSYDVLSHGSIETTTDARATDENIEIDPGSISVVFVESLFVSVSVNSGVTLDYGTLPTAGTYALYLGNTEDGIRLNSFTIPAHTELKKIDKKYIDYDWDNIENKPFYDDTIPEQTIEVDYTGERESVNIGEATLYYHKISNQVYTLELIQDFVVSILHEYLDEDPTVTQTFDDIVYGDIETAENEEEIFWIQNLGNAILGNYDDNGFPLFIVVSEDNTNLDGLEFAEKGLYAIEFYYEGYVDQKLISITTPEVTNIHKLDKKFVEVDWENVDNKPFGEIERPLIKFELPNPLPETKVLINGGIGEYYQFYYTDVGLSQLGSLLANPSNYYYYYELTHNNTTTNGTILLSSASWSYYEKDGTETTPLDCDYAVVEYDDNNNHIHIKIIGIGDIDEDTSIIYGEDTIDNIAKGYLLVSTYEECTENQGQYDYYCTQPILISDSPAPIATLSESRLSDSADIELDELYLYRVGNALLDNNEPIDLLDYCYEYKYNQDNYSSGYNTIHNTTSFLSSIAVYATLNNVDMYPTGYNMIVLNVISDNATITWDPIGNDDPNELITITIPTAGLYFSMDPNDHNQYISALYSKNTIVVLTNSLDYYIGNNNIDNEISYLYYVGDEESFDPTIEDWRNATAIMRDQNDTQTIPLKYVLPDDDDDDLDYMFTNNYQMIEYIFYIKYNNTTIELDSTSYVFPYKGFYFLYMFNILNSDIVYVTELTFPKGTTIKKLDLDYTHHSWNDLEDRPFYSIQHDAITYELPDPLPQTKFVADYEPGVIKKYYSLENQEGFEEATRSDNVTFYYRHIVNGVEDANLLSISDMLNNFTPTGSDDGYLYYYNNGIDSNNHLELVMVHDDGDTVNGTVFTNDGMYITTLEYQTATSNDGPIVEQYIPDSIVATADVSAPSTWGSPDVTFMDNQEGLQGLYRIDSAWNDQDLENKHTYWHLIEGHEQGEPTETFIDGYLINAMSMYGSVFNSTNGYCTVYVGSLEQDDTELSHALEGPFVLFNITDTDTLTIDMDGDSQVFSNIPAGLYAMNYFADNTTFEFLSIGKNVNFTFDFSGDPDEIRENTMTYIECYNTGIETSFTEDNIDNLEITIYDDDTELTTLTGGYMLENMSSSFDWHDTWDRLAFGLQVKYKDTSILDAFDSWQYLDKGLWMGRSFLGLNSWKTCIVVDPAYEEVKKIDSKYLPSNAGGGGDSFPEGENQGDIIQFDGTDWSKHAFPPAQSANANKLIGFDSNGNYAAINKSADEGGGVTSWNDLTDKPFDSETIAAVNIDMTNKEYIDTYTVEIPGYEETITATIYKISDDYIPYENRIYVSGTINAAGQTSNISLNSATAEENIIKLNDDSWKVIADLDYMTVFCSISDEATVTLSGNTIILEPGFYVIDNIMSFNGQEYSWAITNITIIQHEIVHQIEDKYINFPELNYLNLSNKPFGIVISKASNYTNLPSDLSSVDRISLNGVNYYKISDKILSYELACGLTIDYAKKIDNSGNYSGNCNTYYTYQSSPRITIKEITGKKNDNSYSYIAAYIEAFNKYPLLLSIPDNFDGYIQYPNAMGILNTNITKTTGGTWVFLKQINSNPVYYEGIYSYSSLADKEYYKKISSSFLDTDNIDYNTLKNKPVGICQTSDYFYGTISDEILKNDTASFTLNGSPYYYLCNPLEEDSLYALSITSGIRYPDGSYYSSSNSQSKYIKDLIVKRFISSPVDYYMVYDETISSISPILCTFNNPTYSIATDLTGKFLTNVSIMPGTYVKLERDTSTTPYTYTGIYLYSVNSSLFIKKLDANYIDFSSMELTSLTKIQNPYLYSVLNISNNAGYNYTIIDSSDSNYHKRIFCTYDTGYDYGLGKVIIKVPTPCYLHIQLCGAGNNSYVYISAPILLENDTGCPFSASTSTQSNYSIRRYNTSSSITSSYNLDSSGTYILYIKNLYGTPSQNLGYMDLKLSTSSSESYNASNIYTRTTSLEDYIQETINNMFEIGQGGAF